MALGALVVVGLVALAVVVLLRSRGTAQDRAAEADTPPVNALEVPVGQCLNSGGLSDPNLVVVTSCSTAHDATVFAQLRLTDAETASDAAIRAAADKNCQAAVPAGAGTDVEVSFFYPNADDAATNGDRRLTCVYDNSGDPAPSQ